MIWWRIAVALYTMANPVADRNANVVQAVPAIQDALVQKPECQADAQCSIVATPNFDTVFRAKVLRRSYVATKKKSAKARPCVHRVLVALKSRLQRCCRCCQSNYCALKTQSDVATGKTLAKIAHWRANWMVTPRALKRNALLLHLRMLRSQQSQPSGHASQWSGKAVVSLPHAGAIRRYTFLGGTYCKTAFEVLAGVNVSRSRKLMNQGAQTIVEKRNVKRTVGDQMSSAIWLMANELNEESPYARDRDKTVLHLPFHQKVCLWRLILKAHEQRQQSAIAVPLFSRMPTYSQFKATIALEEFSKLSFHRLVDIGRCSKCEFFKWKCASVAPFLRPIYQDALATHHLLSIQQKRCYERDRAHAASDFPNSELYVALKSKSKTHTPLSIARSRYQQSQRSQRSDLMQAQRSQRSDISSQSQRSDPMQAHRSQRSDISRSYAGPKITAIRYQRSDVSQPCFSRRWMAAAVTSSSCLIYRLRTERAPTRRLMGTRQCR